MAFAGFLAVLFFAPLAFGTTETWSMFTAELLVTLTALSLFFPLLKQKPTFYQIPGIAPLLLLLCWIFLQTVPLPVHWVQFISPHAAAAYQPALDLLPPDTWISVSVNRQATLLEGLRFGSCILLYALTVQLLTSSSRLAVTVSSVVGVTLFIAFVTILQRAVAPNTLFWFRELKSYSGSFGPWVYKNQYAGFMGMTCPLVLALSLLHRPIADEDASLRERLLHFFSGAGANLHLFLGFSVIVVIASVLLAQSRGGFLSLAFTLLLFFLLLARSQKKIQMLPMLVLLIGLFLTGGWFSWTAIVEKFNSTFDVATGSLQDGRLAIWKDSVKIIPHYLFTGTGFGTFVDVFPGYKSFADNLICDHAHNDYLELLTDGGLIGFFLAAWFVIVVLRNGWRQIFLRQDRLSVLTSIGAFSGLAGLLFFSITDFNLHNGANGLYFFFLCGLLISAGHTRQHYRHRPTLLALATSPGKAKTAAFLSAAVLLVAVLRLQGGEILADRHYQRAYSVSAASSSDMGKQLVRMTELLEQAQKNAPFNALYPYALANIQRYQQQDGQTALQLYSDALLLQPLEGKYLQAAGLMLAETDLKQARRLVQTGYINAKLKEVPFRTWVEFELSQKKRAKARRILRKELKHNPIMLSSVHPLLTAYRFTREETAFILPQLTSSWLTCAGLTHTAGNQADAGYFIEHALEYLDQEPTAQPHYFLHVYSYYQQQKQEEKAVEVLREGIRRLPDYAPFHIYLGDYYQGKGITYRAIEEYKQALLIQPGDEAVQKKLKWLKREQQQP